MKPSHIQDIIDFFVFCFCFLFCSLYSFFLQLVQVNDLPRIKLSHDIEKVTIPGIKQVYRLYGEDGEYTARFLS